MANTYTQIHIQAIFAVRNRDCVISPIWQPELYKYITGIVQNNKHKLLAINGMPDHLHLMIGLRPAQSISELLQDIKGSSSAWINQKRFLKTRFSWQEGYGAFSYSKKELPNVIHYIMNQQQHHQKETFIKEYTSLLDEFEVDFDERYLFESIDY
jgi:putative transposase